MKSKERTGTSLMRLQNREEVLKVPWRKIKHSILILIMRVEENLNLEKSPNEDMSVMEIIKCLKYRDDLLGELSMKWSTWKEPEPNPEPEQNK